MSERKTLQILTASDEAIFQTRELAGKLAPPHLPSRCDHPGVVYLRAGEPSYVDDEEDVISVEGPVEVEPDTSVHGRACLSSVIEFISLGEK